jgi:glycosyl transferase family 25
MESYIYNPEYLGLSRIANFIIGKDIPQIIVINLSSRQDRRDRIITEMARHKLPFSFFTAIPHKNGVRGCLESHVSVIKWARNINFFPQVCIFEDDVLIKSDLSKMLPIPANYDMAYLGGLVTEIYEWGELDKCKKFNECAELINDRWIKGQIYCNHSYIIRDTVFDVIINEGWEYEQELDRFYTTFIHGQKDKYNAYVTYVQHVIQMEDWSDIEARQKWKNFSWPKPGDMFTLT